LLDLAILLTLTSFGEVPNDVFFYRSQRGHTCPHSPFPRLPFLFFGSSVRHPFLVFSQSISFSLFLFFCRHSVSSSLLSRNFRVSPRESLPLRTYFRGSRVLFQPDAHEALLRLSCLFSAPSRSLPLRGLIPFVLLVSIFFLGHRDDRHASVLAFFFFISEKKCYSFKYITFTPRFREPLLPREFSRRGQGLFLQDLEPLPPFSVVFLPAAVSPFFGFFFKSRFEL